MPRALMIILAILYSFSVKAQDTELKLFRPFGGTEQQIPLIIDKHLAGECWQQSQRIAREDAWRCLAQGQVFDPCFIKKFSDNTEALCPQSPWVGRSVLLKLNTAADNSQHTELDMSRTYPWAVELLGGEQCEAARQSETIENLPVRYYCNDQTILMGHLQRCKAEWTILKRDAAGRVTTVTVKKAWF
ncbi:hypothetical protein Lrub_0668 [Legionella rubrilucens]|uniref:Uncharacterized protein n=1 Tax=Legionella rubrilucens TaxID=458 RepID=A0A0W0XXL2_9GAMM|nr:hypothetical protein [Legionella rubrilucens]KTD49569.1 hypothetical protein Lrub_0668 [Legionella rubrilucens]